MEYQKKWMNSFVNLKKRGVQLPNGSKNLLDILEGGKQGKCEFCGAPPEDLLYLCIKDSRLCADCLQDLCAFAENEAVKFDFDSSDEAAAFQFCVERQLRQDEFMRQRVKERKLK